MRKPSNMIYLIIYAVGALIFYLVTTKSLVEEVVSEMPEDSQQKYRKRPFPLALFKWFAAILWPYWVVSALLRKLTSAIIKRIT